jgi:hypothetical protein
MPTRVEIAMSNLHRAQFEAQMRALERLRVAPRPNPAPPPPRKPKIEVPRIIDPSVR